MTGAINDCKICTRAGCKGAHAQSPNETSIGAKNFQVVLQRISYDGLLRVANESVSDDINDGALGDEEKINELNDESAKRVMATTRSLVEALNAQAVEGQSNAETMLALFSTIGVILLNRICENKNPNTLTPEEMADARKQLDQLLYTLREGEARHAIKDLVRHMGEHRHKNDAEAEILREAGKDGFASA